MEFPTHNWTEGNPESQGLDSGKLAEAMAFLQQKTGSDGVREAVVIRNGCLVWKGDNVDRKHGVWSCSKSFASAVLGILIEDGKCTLDSLAADWVPNLRKDYSTVTLRHFATMTSGYQSAGPYYYGEVDPVEGSSNYHLPIEPLFAPGTRFSYWDNAMRKFGQVLAAIAEEPIDSFFQRRIAGPIGMVNWSWEYDNFPRQIPPDLIGVKDIAGGVETTAREIARFGYLFLNRGSWDGKQLLSPAWVAESTTVQVPATLPRNVYSKRQREIDGLGVYGCMWWANGRRADGEWFLPGAPESTFFASGYNGNLLFVIPAWEMVVARLGTDQSQSPNGARFWGEFMGMLGKSIR